MDDIFGAVKFDDIKEAYSYTCKEFKDKVIEGEYVSSWKKRKDDAAKDGTFIQDFVIDDIVIADDSAKVRFSMIFYNPLTKEFKSPAQAKLNFISGK